MIAGWALLLGGLAIAAMFYLESVHGLTPWKKTRS